MISVPQHQLAAAAAVACLFARHGAHCAVQTGPTKASHVNHGDKFAAGPLQGFLLASTAFPPKEWDDLSNAAIAPERQETCQGVAYLVLAALEAGNSLGCMDGLIKAVLPVWCSKLPNGACI